MDETDKWRKHFGLPPVEILTREEWMRRYAARFVAHGFDADAAAEAARVGADVQAENGEPWTDPEEAADDELSCWTDDE